MIRDVDVAHAALAAQTIKIEIINLACASEHFSKHNQANRRHAGILVHPP
jgi:hypothetical protein